MVNYNCKFLFIFMIFISIVEVYNCEFFIYVYFMIYFSIVEVIFFYVSMYFFKKVFN